MICSVSDDTWDESTMTWATRPAVSATCAGTSKSIDADMEVGWDVTSLVKAGANVNLAIVSKDSNGAHYLSKEGGGTAQGPRLIVELAEGGAGGSGATGSGGSGWGNGGAPLDASYSGGSGGASAGGTESDDGGCGCRTANRSRSTLFATLIGALALAAARARRRRA